MSAWSPMPWQRERWSQITGAIADGRLAHALLLAGPRGAGKGHFARGLASYLLCEATAGAKPCGECRSCVQIAAGVHPNLLRLAPAEDKRDIAIDDIRDVLERLHLSSHYGQAKIAVIDPADALNLSGANALLKTVEEPPANTHLVFVAERWRALPATLRSRCQILRFPPAPAGAVAADPAIVAERVEWGRALAEILGGSLSLKIAQGLKRDQAQAGIEYWLHAATGWLRQLLAGGASSAVPKGASVPALQQLLADCVEALRSLRRNGSPTLLVESIMIRLSQRTPQGR